MEWQNAFPELIEAFDALTDQTALQTYIDAVTVAGQERAAFEGDLDDATLDECDAFAASVVAAQARIDELVAEAAAEEAAKLSRDQRKAALKFGGATTPPPVVTNANGGEQNAGTENNSAPAFEAKPRVVVAQDLPSYRAETTLDSKVDQARALFERASRLQRSGTGEKFTVLQVVDYIDPALAMPEDGMEQFRMLRDDRYDQEGLTAGFCAPAPIDLAFCGGSPATRPVFASLRRYGAPRGRVRKIKTPLFNQLGTDPDEVDLTGLGVWTNDDDDADPFVNKTCSIVTCPTEEEFELYAIYKCVVIKNLMQLAFPEWVAWYLQAIDAHWARDAEIGLLDQMLTRAGAAITATTTYGALASVVTRVNQLMNNYVENERYDDAGLVAWAPRWLKRVMYDDWFRRTGTPMPAGTIERAFADVGVSKINWTYDNPTAHDDVIRQAKGVPLEDYPADAWFILTRGDNLRLMDFQARDIGITTEKVYRDTSTNLANNFQMFVESFEGIIDMGCPVWHFTMPICANGLLAPVSGYNAEPCGTQSQINDTAPTGDE